MARFWDSLFVFLPAGLDFLPRGPDLIRSRLPLEEFRFGRKCLAALSCVALCKLHNQPPPPVTTLVSYSVKWSFSASLQGSCEN